MIFLKPFYINRISASEFHLLRIAYPVRRWNNDFISFIQNHLEKGVQSMFGTSADNNLRRFVFNILVTFKFLCNAVFSSARPPDGVYFVWPSFIERTAASIMSAVY